MTVTNYLWDEDSYLEEYDDAGTTTAAYTNEPTEFGSVISQRRNSETSFNHYDAQGSTHQLTDQNENVTDTFLYDAWGNEVDRTGTTTAPFRYIGEFGYYFDEETDSYYVRARVYQPLIGRWWSVDPMGFIDTANLYTYVNNNPLFFIDPNGTEIWSRGGDDEPRTYETALITAYLKEDNNCRPKPFYKYCDKCEGDITFTLVYTAKLGGHPTIGGSSALGLASYFGLCFDGKWKKFEGTPVPEGKRGRDKDGYYHFATLTLSIEIGSIPCIGGSIRKEITATQEFGCTPKKSPKDRRDRVAQKLVVAATVQRCGVSSNSIQLTEYPAGTFVHPPRCISCDPNEDRYPPPPDVLPLQ